PASRFLPGRGPAGGEAVMRSANIAAWLRLLLAAALSGAAQVAAADQRILDFPSDNPLAPHARLAVTQTIPGRAEGTRIRHGIYRDFPTDYRDRYGNRVRVGFELLSAQRDGHSEDARSERFGNGVRVYLGSAASQVAAGEHAYEIRYRTTRQLGFFA